MGSSLVTMQQQPDRRSRSIVKTFGTLLLFLQFPVSIFQSSTGTDSFFASNCHKRNEWIPSAENSVLESDDTRTITREESWGAVLEVECPSVLYSDGVYKMWYSSDEVVAWKINYAESLDGVHWTKLGTVIDVGENGSWDSKSVAYPFVLKDENAPESERYKMWYSGRGLTGEAEAVGGRYRIGYASSPDGLHWAKFGPVFDLNSYELHHIDPTIIQQFSGFYQMWFNVLDEDRGRLIKYAESSNGYDWTVFYSPAFFVDTNRDSKSDIYTTTVLREGAVYRMWFSPNTLPESKDVFYAEMKNPKNGRSGSVNLFYVVRHKSRPSTSSFMARLS